MMNALMVLICVIKCVLTLLDPTSVPVIVDMTWGWIKRLVLVSIYNDHIIHLYTFGIHLAYIWHTFGIHLAYIWHTFGIHLAYIIYLL